MGSEDKSDGREIADFRVQGQPYVFVVMRFQGLQPVRDAISSTIEDRLDVRCIRADDLLENSRHLRDKIHRLIQGADVVVALVTDTTPNVMYEVGYASAINKPLILVIDENKTMPANIEGLEVLKYNFDSYWGHNIFQDELVDRVRAALQDRVFLLRDMLEAPVRTPAYVVASPKYPSALAMIAGQPRDRRTFGDNLGIRGLFSAFGVMMGEGAEVELVSAQYAHPEVANKSLNLYLIGSSKVNPLTEQKLPQLIGDGCGSYFFAARHGYSELKGYDWPCVLYERTRGRARPIVGRLRKAGSRNAHQMWQEDYGIIVRGPHPRHDGRIVMIMAGAHSLGSGAACLGATRPELIREIAEALPKGVLEDKQSTFSVLVRGTASAEDGLLDPRGCEIVRVSVHGVPN